MGLHTFQILGVSSRKLLGLQQRLIQSGFEVNPTSTGFHVIAPQIAGHLFYNPATYTLSVDLREVPDAATPGFLVGLFYDEINALPDG